MPSKRFQGSSFFLTYPQIQDHSDDARLRLLQFLQQLGQSHETELTYALISRERHGGRDLETGGRPQQEVRNSDEERPSQGSPGVGTSLEPREPGYHWHCVAHYSSKLRLRERAFDFEGHHPNIRTVGRAKSDWNKVTLYCRKEDASPLEYGSPRHSCKSLWSEVVGSSSRSEAEQLIKKEKARDWIINRRAIDYALDKMFPMQQDAQLHHVRPSSQFRLPTSLKEWMLENFM